MATGFWRVYMDGNEYTNVGDVQITEVEFERGDRMKGFFKKYVQKVKLFFDAYAYALERFTDTGGCGSIEVTIQYKCTFASDWDTLVEGHILLTEIEFDETLCIVTADVEDDNVTQLLMDKMDFKVDLDAETRLDGVSLPPIRRYIRDFQHFDGVYVTETYNTDFAEGYRVYDAFNKILNYISDGQLLFASDFFSTRAINRTWTINLSPRPVNGDIVGFNFITELGDEVSYFITHNGSDTDFTARVSAMLSAGGYLTTSNLISGAIVFVVRSYDVDNSLSVYSSGASVITNTVTNNYVSGAKGLCITDGYRLSARNDKQMKMSFAMLLDIVERLYDVSFAIEYVSGQYYLRMEPLEDILDNAPTLTLENVKGITIRPLKDRIKSNLLLGSTKQTPGNRTYNFKNLTCGGIIDKTIDSLVNILPAEIIDQIRLIVDNPQEYYLVDCNGFDLATTPPVGNTTNAGYYDTPRITEISAIGAFPVFTTEYHFNYLLFGNTKLLKYHLFFLPDAVLYNVSQFTFTVDSAGTVTNGTPVVTADSVGFEKQYISTADFEYPVRYTDFKQINGFSLIQFNKGSSAETVRLGYVNTLTHPVQRGTAKFSLLVK